MSSDEDSSIESGSDIAEESGIHHFSARTTEAGNSDVKRGTAVRAQMGLWDGLLETRIKLQKPLASCNRLPQREIFSEFVKSADEPTAENLKGIHDDLRTFMSELIGLQDQLFSRNPAVMKPVLASDDEDGDDLTKKREGSEESEANITDPGFSLDSLEKRLDERHCKLEPFRNATLETWNNKTQQFSVGAKKNFAAFEQSPVNQINQIMTDRKRLVERTHVPRTVYSVLGISDKSASSEEKSVATECVAASSQNAQIFDDDDFYHQLLKELIERKTGNISDPVELSRQQIQLMHLRKPTKKVVDSKATRDRKIRFDPHPKLVSFMAPEEVCQVTEQARNDLYKSLFGKLRTNHDTKNQLASVSG